MVRYVILSYLCFLTMVLYLDRVCIAQAAQSIRTEMKLSETELGIVFASFTVAYALFMTIAGQ